MFGEQYIATAILYFIAIGLIVAKVIGPGKIMVRYLAKAIGGRHQIRTVLKSTQDGRWLANKGDYIESRDQWEEIECFFLVDPSVDFLIRFDDRDVSVAPSSIQIRDIVVTEKAF